MSTGKTSIRLTNRRSCTISINSRHDTLACRWTFRGANNATCGAPCVALSTFWGGLHRRCPPAASTTCCKPQGLFCTFLGHSPRIRPLASAGPIAAATARAALWAAAGASGAAELCWHEAWHSRWAERAGRSLSRPSLHRRSGGRGPSRPGCIKVRSQQLAQGGHQTPKNTPLSNRSMLLLLLFSYEAWGKNGKQPSPDSEVVGADVGAEQIGGWAGAGRLQTGGNGGKSADQACPSETPAEKEPSLLFRLLPDWFPFNSRGRRCTDMARSRPLQSRWRCSSI